MRTLGRFFLMVLALMGVSALGYYAYVLGAETLTYPFVGSDKQKGDTLEMIFSRPRFMVDFVGGPIIDPDAIAGALMIDDRPLRDVVSGEQTVTVSGEYVRVFVPGMTGETVVRLEADIYNDTKTTRYRLPRDISLTALDAPRLLDIVPVGLPRDRKYAISMHGFGDYTPEHIRYFISHDMNTPCNLMTRWSDFRPIFPSTSTPIIRDASTSEMQVTFDFNLSTPYLCMIAGVNGVYKIIEERSLEAFTVTGAVIDTLSPEYDMQSRIEFRFSHPIYTDTGALYSPEYLSHRQNAKIDFLKHLSVSPDIPLTPENVILTPDRAILTLPLPEGQKTTISLKGIQDIYGRTAVTDMDITPKQEPFLSIKLEQDKIYYQKDQTIGLKIYALKAPKSTYDIKLCRVPLGSYARMERILSDTLTQASIDETYSILEGKESFGCMKKEVVLSATGYVSRFSAQDILVGGKVYPGMYLMYLATPEDGVGFSKPVKPVIFTVMDTHITMKVDASGKMLFLATDMTTGKPLPDQEITLMRNITRTYKETWNATTSTMEREYLPLTLQAFATGMVLGRTDSEGMLDTKVTQVSGLEDYVSSPYGLSFESWWDYEGRYDSFLVMSKNGERLGLLTSTWNDGITGYNFGMKESDYSYQTKPKYTSYLHTDRRLYLPGETVHIHGIIRENSNSLKVPGDVTYSLITTDMMGKEVNNTTIKPNEFGTISADILLPKDVQLGMYNISLATTDNTEYVQNGWTSFQVEVFKNPTFTATVELRSPDIVDGSVKNLRKKENIDTNTPWYTDVYEGKFGLEGVVKAKYYNGSLLKNTTFTYRIYRSEYYGEGYWDDCFWGCYYEPYLEYYTEGTGTIDADGYGVFSTPIDYTSYYSDYQYTAEVTIRDPLSGEEVTTPSTLVVRLPVAYKSFSPYNSLIFTPKKKILQNGESLQGVVDLDYGSWDASLAGKYKYEIIHREYQETPVDDIRAGKIHITSAVDTVKMQGIIQSKDFSEKLIAYPAGEYIFRLTPVTASGVVAPDTAKSETLFYIAGAQMTAKNSSLRVIPEKTIYTPGETARVMVTVPFTGAQILLTLEKGGVLQKEVFTLSGNTFTREYKVDDTLIPNAYVGVVALSTQSGSASRSYAVGYGEIIADYTEKKGNLTLVTDKQKYKNRDRVSLDMTLADRSGNPLQGEVAIMVVDESLIRLLGNIDLDIIPKFYQKYPFTMKTSLSAIGIERDRWLSRKGSNGGSGDKGGGGVEISSRSLFQNTAYYNPSIRTDASGKAKIQFTLPDNVTDYRIIAIANTKDAHFAVGEKTIEVRKDYVIEAHAPMVIRPGDTSRITASVFNTTKNITAATLTATIGTGSQVVKKTLDLTLNPSESVSRDFDFVAQDWPADVPYRIDLKSRDILLDSYTSSFRFAPIPEIESSSREILIYTGSNMTYTLPLSFSGMDPASSRVSISISPSYAAQISEVIESLVQYPYGCIEQTIGSTLPNAFALKFSKDTGVVIDRAQAEQNVTKGLAKILRMQHYSGGWRYWEGDFEAEQHITPYVLRSLITFQNLGYTIPDEVLANGGNYIINNLFAYKNSEDSYAEAVWTLAQLGRTAEALESWKNVDTQKLSRHGYIAYAYAAHILGTYTPEISLLLDQKVFASDASQSSYWYWDHTADRAIYTQLLYDRGEYAKATALIDQMLKSTDLSSYFVSTQAKLQIFRALVKQSDQSNATLSKNIDMALRGDALIADATIRRDRPYVTIETTREKLGKNFSLKRDDARTPLYVTVTIRDRTRRIVDMPAKNTPEMKIIRTFELVDESKGVDKEGRFISLTPVTDGVFSKGKLYRVTLKTMMTGSSPWYNLAIEDYYPGGWRPINTRLHTESSLLQSNNENSWSYLESRDDRLLVHMPYGDTPTRTHTYYIRPSIVGTYLLPPAYSYMMYRPGIHAYTQYERVEVR